MMTSSPTPGNATSNETWEGMFKDLVPLSTQLVTPALAEAFQIPTANAAVPHSQLGQPVPQLGQFPNPGVSGQTKSSYQIPLYQVRPGVGVEQQQQHMQNFFPQPAQTGCNQMGGNQQPAAVHNEPQPQGHGQQRHGMTRQIQGLGAPTIQQGMYNVKSEEPGQQGYMSSGNQFSGWLDQATGASPMQPPQASGKLLQDSGLEDGENPDDFQTRALKRPRLVWTAQLHQRFVDAVKQLGLKNAVPKTIMQLMNVDGLTRENVASHLQKYRLQLRKEEGRGEDLDNNFEEDHFAEGEGCYA